MSRLDVCGSGVSELRVKGRNEPSLVRLLGLPQAEKGVVLDRDLPQTLRCFVVGTSEADRGLVLLELQNNPE